ncbi:hypothetical protein GQR58_009139 [Nymphon striatum]|nr:hypothetical protein GQR58_009139 [Nymphon striatum]
MRVSRNPDTGNIHMQYECLPSDSSYQPQPYSTTNKVNYSSNEVNQGKKNPPKTVRELLEEYRQKLYYPETTYRYCPEDSDKSSYHYVQQYNSSVVQNPEYRTEPTDSSNEMYSTNYTVDSKVQSPVPSSNVSNVSNNDPIYSNYADQPYTSYQQFSNEEDHCDMNSTKSVQISSLESGSAFINTPLTPDNTDTSIVSPAQSEEMTTSTRTSLPGIQYIKGISFEHYFTKSIEQDKNTGDLNTIPEFIEGPVDVKEHRPRHFEMLSLQIGVFNAVEISHNCESRKMTNKFKVLFSKRRLVYEFIWPNRQFDSVKTDVIELACIYVPFKSIEALNITENEVIVHVNCKPHIYGGSKQSSNGIVSSANIFNTKKELDITDGQLSLAPVHKVTLKSNQCSKLKNFLTAFDRRFWYLLHREIPQAAYNETVLPEYTESIQKNSVQTPCKRMLDKKGAFI